MSLAIAGGVYLTFEGLVRPRERLLVPLQFHALREFLVRAGLHDVTPRDFFFFSIASGGLAAVLVQLFLGWGVVSGLAGRPGVAGAVRVLHPPPRSTPVGRSRTRSSKPSNSCGMRSAPVCRSRRPWPVWRARARSALAAEFANLNRDARLIGFEAALMATRDRLADPVFDVVACALVVNDRLGGRQVSQVLDRLAEATRAQLRIQHEVRAQQGRSVLSARIVAAAPLVALVGLRATNPRYLSIFDGVWGQMVLIGCAVSIALGYAAMLYLTRLPGQRRVLVR